MTPVASRFQRSDYTDYLVTFKISLTVAEDVEPSEQLSGVLSKIENIKPDSLEIIEQQAYNEEALQLDALDTKVGEISNYLASNLTEITASLEMLEEKMNSSDATYLQQRLDKLESEDLPELRKMTRHSIKKGKENASSIEELRNHDHSWGPPINQSTPNNFDMINTLMVRKLSGFFY